MLWTVIAMLVVVVALSPQSESAISGTFDNPGFEDDRTTIVELFEWTWTDVAQECEEFLGPHGYGAVQVSPPSENAVQLYTTPGGDKVRSWYERYEPVSYQISSPSGDLEEFAEMVSKCDEAKVRVFVDVVLNHMTSDVGEGRGYNGSAFNSDNLVYEAVPYQASDFHSSADCGTPSGEVEDYSNVVQVRNCKFRGRADLNHHRENVRQRIVEYLRRLVSLGVTGFKIDAAQYIWPEGLAAIYEQLKPATEGDNSLDAVVLKTLFIYHELSTLNVTSADDYRALGAVTDSKFFKKAANILRKTKGSELRDLKQDVLHQGSSKDVRYIDSHETQRGVDISDPKQDVVSYQDRRNHVLANVLLMAMPQGTPRVMSSYTLDADVQPYVPPKKLGPPSDHAFNTRPVLKGKDYACYNGWICEHRWLPIRNMVKFRNAVASAPVTNWWDNSEDAVAFARLRKGFVLINNGRSTVTGLFNTTLPQGYYCDVLSGSSVDRRSCTGKVVRVREDGFAELAVESVGDVPAVAIQSNVS
ncbi:unnamed protein product [Ixodes hexagonus]